MRGRRALLYVPGDDLRKIQKAAALGVSGALDCLCLDLEDGVAYTSKEEARIQIPQALQSLDFGRAERLVRVNAVSTGLQETDLSTVLPCHPQGIILPKVENAEQIQRVDETIAAVEKQYGWSGGEIALLAIVESARGILNLAQIASACPRLQALALGAEDLAADIGAVRTRSGSEMSYARSALVMHTAAFGLQAIDMVFVDLKDSQGLFQEAQQAFQMGFSGKQIIHPDQIAPVQRAFTPGDEAIANARRLVQAYDRHQAMGKGVFTLDGRMVELPMIQSARRILAQAEENPQMQL
jgi:citrate lyase beta subunit